MNRQHRTITPVIPATVTVPLSRREMLAMIERGDLLRFSEAERHGFIIAFVGALSVTEVQAIGSAVNERAVRRAA